MSAGCLLLWKIFILVGVAILHVEQGVAARVAVLGGLLQQNKHLHHAMSQWQHLCPLHVVILEVHHHQLCSVLPMHLLVLDMVLGACC